MEKKNDLVRHTYDALFRMRIDRVFNGVFQRRKAVILMYHGFTERNTNDGVYDSDKLHVTVDEFTEHIQFLKDQYTIIPLGLFVKHCIDGLPVPDKAVIITIDDGYRSTYTCAFPILQQHGVPATVFLPTDFIDRKHYLWTNRVEYALLKTSAPSLTVRIKNHEEELPCRDLPSKQAAVRKIKSVLKQLPSSEIEQVVGALEEATRCSLLRTASVPPMFEPLTWEQIEKMNASGLVTFGSHTTSHAILTRLHPPDITRELVCSKEIIESRLGMSCKFFCYPNGQPGDFTDLTTSLIKETGFGCALTTVEGTNSSAEDLFTLKRYMVPAGINRAHVAMIACGLNRTVQKVKSRL
jgi:peptidoglycan/xylan/chitin deacetylase (PgdA/CDA1 family)